MIFLPPAPPLIPTPHLGPRDVFATPQEVDRIEQLLGVANGPLHGVKGGLQEVHPALHDLAEERQGVSG